MLNFTSAPCAVRAAEHIEIEELRDPVIALPESGSPERPALNYFSKRCVLTSGVAILAGLTGIVAAAVSELDPRVKTGLYIAGATAILASCCSLIGRAISVRSNRHNEAAQPLLRHAVQIQMTNAMNSRMRAETHQETGEQRQRDRLNQLQQNFQDLLFEAPPFCNNRQEALVGAMQLVLEESINYTPSASQSIWKDRNPGES